MALKRYEEDDVRKIAEAIRLNPQISKYSKFTIDDMPMAIENNFEYYQRLFQQLTNRETKHIDKLPLGITKIGAGLFENYDTLTYISGDIPSGVTHIGESAFSRCYRLNVSLPSTLKYIGDSAFSSCNRSLRCTLPRNLEYIGNSAFNRCSRLSFSTFPSKLKHIGNTAFQQNVGLIYITLPASLEFIGNRAFGDCTSLRKVTFEGTPTSFGTDIFYQCTALKTINVPWSEGEVAGAPWGATNATINYNYVEEEDDD